MKKYISTFFVLFIIINSSAQTFQQALYKHANDVYAGQGISNRHNGDGTIHAYGTLLMLAYYNAYLATGDLRFVDQLAIQCFRIQTHRDDRIRNYNDYDTDQYYYDPCNPAPAYLLPINSIGEPTNTPTWSNITQNNCIWTRFTIHSMSITYPMALLVKLILLDEPILQNRSLPSELITNITADGTNFSLQSFGDLAQFLRASIRETLDWHILFTSFTQHGYNGFRDVEGVNSNTLLAVNMQAAAGKTFALAYLIESGFGNSIKANIYHEKLTKIAELIKGELVQNPLDNYSYSWRHQYVDDCSSGDDGQPGFQNLEDAEHAQIIMDFADICFSSDILGYQQSSLLFEEEDMKKFASTFATWIYINPVTEIIYLDNQNSILKIYNANPIMHLVTTIPINSTGGLSFNGNLFVSDIDLDNIGNEIIFYDNTNEILNVFSTTNGQLALIHSLALTDFSTQYFSTADYDNDGQNEIVAVNNNDGDFYIFKIVDGILKESDREYFPVNFQNGLIFSNYDANEIYPAQLYSIRKFDGKLTVYNMAGKCPNLDLTDFDITEAISIENTYTGAQNDYPIDYHSPNIITASNIVFEPDVTGEFVSGTAIRMKEGFRATAGSEFTARIDEVNLSCDEPFFRKPTQNISLTEPESINIPKGKLLVFPNPTNSTFSFELPIGASSENLIINLYDNSGRLIFSSKVKLKSINISNYAAGIYFLEIKTDAGIFREKIIKN